MKKLSTALAVLAALGILVAVSFSVHNTNPNALRFLPDPVTDFMTDFNWVTWIGTAVAVIAVLSRLALESRLAKTRPRRPAE